MKRCKTICQCRYIVYAKFQPDRLRFELDADGFWRDYRRWSVTFFPLATTGNRFWARRPGFFNSLWCYLDLEKHSQHQRHIRRWSTFKNSIKLFRLCDELGVREVPLYELMWMVGPDWQGFPCATGTWAPLNGLYFHAVGPLGKLHGPLETVRGTRTVTSSEQRERVKCLMAA